MEPDDDRQTDGHKTSGSETPTQLHRVAMLAAALAVVVFAVWRCG
jgi:hypothetical protein